MNKFKTYRESIDIDYYVYFTKAYFAFNAYLKCKYPNNNDTEQIQEIQGNIIVLGKFEGLVNSGKHFKDDLIALRDAITATEIMNNGKVINLSVVKIGKHEVKDVFNQKFNKTQYFIKAIDGDKFTFTVKKYQSNPFSYDDLDQVIINAKISKTQKEKVKSEIIGFVSKYTVNLIEELDKLKSFDEYDSMEQGKIIKGIYQGYMVILYKLRNALFHSEVEPNEDVMKVYKFAYFTLRKIVHKIPVS
ncbi:hypothetical protein [Bathymodiolus septemdierum thioautotrophic gill symbiont]|uniref:Uncharacterized protein n=1 Tax=endosymbiont of Bathymodiolus septemdierum str. Myojin knoll TaxID=1303921 RepID=A0A0N7KBE3_9GAMM|nr:hypothetical protein [Bathymodiolus septemdierum thioautotrophic gill symbiont]BAS67775.1 hypothetical protein BSEPE_0782 [endosymbiont of Bathymodiolus septemdierum str. Myojin knoll]